MVCLTYIIYLLKCSDNFLLILHSFNTTTNQWTLYPDTKPYPWPRYGHSTVFYKVIFLKIYSKQTSY